MSLLHTEVIHKTNPKAPTYCHYPTVTQKYHYTVTTPSENDTTALLTVTHRGVDSHHDSGAMNTVTYNDTKRGMTPVETDSHMNNNLKIKDAMRLKIT